MNYNVKGLNQLSEQLHEFQIEAGFTDSNIVQRLMLVHSEISEAFEAYRKSDSQLQKSEEVIERDKLILENYHDNEWKEFFERVFKDTMEDEIADAIIRLLAICAENNIDIEWHVQQKMHYNELRGFKFGNKKF